MLLLPPEAERRSARGSPRKTRPGPAAISWFLALLAVFAGPQIAAEDFAFELPGARVAIGTDARWKEIRDLATGEDRLLEGDWPIAVLDLQGGGRFEARSAAPFPEGLRVGFEGDAGPRSILLAAEVRSGALVFELRSDPGEDVAQVEFVRAPLAIEGQLGTILNAAWDDRFGAAVLALDASTECSPERARGGALLRARAHRRFGFAGRRAALVAGPSRELRRRIQAAAEAFRLPGTSLGAPFAKDLEAARRSYLFLTDLTEASADRAIAAALRGGFGCILVLQSSFARTTGHYLFDERRFPSGIEGLAELVRRFHAAGLQAGLHVWASKVSKNDPYVTPVPDRRLYFDLRTTLAEPIDERATVLRAADPVSDWPGGTIQRAYEGREADHCDLFIGDEIIRYERAGHPPDPHVFCGLVRGAYGTRASAHPAGTPVLHPKIDGCLPGYVVDQDSSILEEIAERVAGLIDRCRFDMVYFDGGEDVPPPMWHYSTKFQLAVLERTRRRPILHQGTILTHFLWHSFARTNTVDIRTVRVKEHIDASVRGLEVCRANLIPGELGWFGLWPPSGSNPGLQLDEIEYLLARSLAYDAPISIETSLANIEAHPLSGAILDLIRVYERSRLHRDLALEEPIVLWVPASEFRETCGSMDWGGAFGIFDGGAFGPLLVPAAVPDGAARAPPAESRASATVEIPKEGIWYAWARVRYPLAVDHSFWLIAEGQSAILGNCGRNGGAWHWTGRGDGLETLPPGSPIPLRLPAGRVRLSIAPREGGSDPAANPRFDLLCLSNRADFRPDDALAQRALSPRAARVSVVTQAWSLEGRSLSAVLELLDAAGRDAPDLVLLPQECVASEPEPIPGPTSEAIAANARAIRAYVVGCIRESEGAKTFVTSFLLDRSGRLVGKYRKSHKLPDEDMDLGDELPVFDADFGRVAMKIGTDRHFPEIDLVYAAKGASLILWSQAPEPVEDEHLQDAPAQGRAADFGLAIACARYAPPGTGWITNFYPPYCGSPIGRSWVIDREGQRVASTSRRPGVATATLRDLKPGRKPSANPRFPVLTAPVAVPEAKPWKKRAVRVAAIEGHVGIEELLEQLDAAGRMGTDIACTYEFVWIQGPEPEKIQRETETARKNLERVREKAREHHMYVVIAGVIDRIERNEAIIYDRDGNELGRYYKIAKTHAQQIPGDSAPVFETDFGRIAVRICADEWYAELDRAYAVGGADIVFVPTQSWGPDAIFRELRDTSRAMDGGYFLVECTHASTEARHRSRVIDPTGFTVAAAQYGKPGIVTAVLDLDRSRPLRYLRVYDPHKPAGYLPEYQPDRLPRAQPDLRETILRARRPDLYGALVPP